MYDNKPQNMPCESMIPIEENIQEITGEVIELAKRCNEISNSIENGLLGPQACDQGQNERNISCLLDALKEVRHILIDTKFTLENVNRKL